MLVNSHALLENGIVEGFRAPDLCWVGTTQGVDVMDWDPDIANCSGLIFSNFWAGTADQAKGFAQGMAQKFSELFADRNDCADPELAPLVMVFYFDDPTTGLGLVGYISTTEEFMLEQLQESDDFVELMGQAEELMELATDGNDNSPHTLLDSIHDEWPVDRNKIVELVLSATKPELRDEVRQVSFQT